MVLINWEQQKDIKFAFWPSSKINSIQINEFFFRAVLSINKLLRNENAIPGMDLLNNCYAPNNIQISKINKFSFSFRLFNPIIAPWIIHYFWWHCRKKEYMSLITTGFIDAEFLSLGKFWAFFVHIGIWDKRIDVISRKFTYPRAFVTQIHCE